MAITFGRFTDSYKPKAKTEFWAKCEQDFTDKKFMDSYEAFFNYLKDEAVSNVNWTRTDGVINFELLQGSQRVSGTIGGNKVIAESYVAEYEKLSVAFMRRLMELNYSLYYSRFCLKDNKIVIKFDSSIADGSPRKLYYAFKEVATRADKQDDLLTDDFSMLKSLGRQHVEEIAEAEREVKYKYFRKWLEDAVAMINSVNEDALSGGISYVLLNLLYKIDYLIAPEGTLLNELEKISFGYFAKDNKPFVQKNRDMKTAFEKIMAWPKEKVVNDIYKTKSTFGVANPVPHQAVLDLFANNINNVKWYTDNKHENFALQIYEYLATYCLFSYGMPRPSIELFHLMLNVTNQQYFMDLGLTRVYYDQAAGKLNEPEIKGAIAQIVLDAHELYPEFKFNVDSLKFDTLMNFLRTYIEEIKNLNYNS